VPSSGEGGGHQLKGVTVLRLVENGLGLAVFHHFAIFHHHNPVTDGSYDFQIMADKQIAEIMFLLKRLQ